MPEMDGFEATSIIRDPKSKVCNHDVPVVAMTAYAMKRDRERCIEVGMDDYVAKPIEPQKFLDAIERQIPASASAGARAADETALDEICITGRRP